MNEECFWKKNKYFGTEADFSKGEKKKYGYFVCENKARVVVRKKQKGGKKQNKTAKKRKEKKRNW